MSGLERNMMISKFLEDNEILIKAAMLLFFLIVIFLIYIKTGKKLTIRAIKYYQRHISGKIPLVRCKYKPTCSQYALTAIKRHGLQKGGWLAAKRLARCNPLSKGGYDPVPGKVR